MERARDNFTNYEMIKIFDKAGLPTNCFSLSDLNGRSFEFYYGDKDRDGLKIIFGTITGGQIAYGVIYLFVSVPQIGLQTKLLHLKRCYSETNSKWLAIGDSRENPDIGRLFVER